jgi:hypothetical protein
MSTLDEAKTNYAHGKWRESVDIHEESDFVPAKEYHVLKKDPNGGSATFISSHKDRNKAYKKRDRLDDQYGSYIHSVKPVYDEKESCKDGGCNESLIDNIFKNDLVESTNSFNKILADKITSKLDEAKIQVAQSMFV